MEREAWHGSPTRYGTLSVAKKWGKQLTARLVRHFGFVLIPAWQERLIVLTEQEHTFPTARYLQRLFKFLSVDCVIDVGANLGQYRAFLRDEVGYQGIIVSFEPIPSHAQVIKNQARSDPNWHVEECALGATPGRLTLNVMADDQFSSFLNPNHDEVKLFREKNKVCEQIEVEVKTLDKIIPTIRDRYLARNIYLKLDTQGFDLEVIKGLEKNLGEVRALQFEASVRKIYDGAPRYDEVIRYCEQRGFLMSGIFPNNAGHFPVLVEFDCFMVGQEWGDIKAIPTGTR
jgi:FkbM family methyltransferase